MRNIPIAIRSCNRAVYLDTTLRSLSATDLPKNPRIIVFDDCSEDEITRKYLFSDTVIELENQETWLGGRIWNEYVGDLPKVDRLVGIKSKFEVVQPEAKKGTRGGIFWIIDQMMTKFPTDECIMVIEADVVFNRLWYSETQRVYDLCKDETGPNGPKLGLLTAYDRKPKSRPKEIRHSWTWRSVKKLSNGNWGCGNGIGGVHYLVTRSFYNSAIGSMKRTYHPSLRSGDTALQAECGNAKFNIAATVPSYIQHIGHDSLAWRGQKGWRYARNFLKPFVLKERL